jgi:hypothetical protein
VSADGDVLVGLAGVDHGQVLEVGDGVRELGVVGGKIDVLGDVVLGHRDVGENVLDQVDDARRVELRELEEAAVEQRRRRAHNKAHLVKALVALVHVDGLAGAHAGAEVLDRGEEAGRLVVVLADCPRPVLPRRKLPDGRVGRHNHLSRLTPVCQLEGLLP